MSDVDVPVTVRFPCTAAFPVTRRLPLTSRVAAGVSVSIPTLPPVMVTVSSTPAPIIRRFVPPIALNPF